MDHQIVNNALRNHLILNKIFSYLDLADLKACRLMCTLWEKESRLYIIRNSVCCIRNTDSIKTNLLTVFPDTLPDSAIYQFRCFRLEGRFSADDVKIFFADRSNIKELTVYDLEMINEDGKHIYEYDMTKWSGLSLTSLTIESCLFTLQIPLTYLAGIKNIKLDSVTIILNGRIAPENLTIQDSYSVDRAYNYKGDWDEEKLDLNQYVHGSNLKTLKIYDSFFLQELLLDLTDLRYLEHLALGTTAYVIGCHNELILKRLDIPSSGGPGVMINLSALPNSVEELNINCFTDERLQYLPTDSFPNVKSLGLCKNLPLLTQCPNLIRLELYGTFDLNPMVLPRSLKVIKTDAPKLKFGYLRDCHFQLDKIIFEHNFSFDWNEICRAINKFGPKVVVFNCLPAEIYNASVTVCGRCGCSKDHVYPVVQRQIKPGDSAFKFVLGRVYTPFKGGFAGVKDLWSPIIFTNTAITWSFA